jgi:hypothetical protein
VTVTDDPTISNADLAYRRIHPEQLADDLDGGTRPSSAAFRPNRNDDLALSVYLDSVMTEIKVLPTDCVLPGAGHTLAEVEVSEIRSLGHGVVRDPVADALVSNPCDPAHALITGFEPGRGPMGRQARALAEKARRIS